MSKKAKTTKTTKKSAPKTIVAKAAAEFAPRKSIESGDVLFEKKLLVHFSDCDPQGIVFYARYFDWAHAVIEEFWASVPNGWERWFQNADLAVPLRHAEANYLAPVVAGEEITAHLTVERIGETSVSFETQFSCDGSPAAAVKTVHVFVQRKDFRATSVPADILVDLQ
jgi:YbgC/YbaW family acyl-CoA thioester hydrolase